MFMMPASSGANINATVTDSDSSVVSQTNYSFVGVGIGTAYAGRNLFLFVYSPIKASSDPDISAITIGGSVPTLIHSITYFGMHILSIYNIVISTGTAADVAITFDEAATSCAVLMMDIKGLNATPIVTSGFYDDASPPYEFLSTYQPAGAPKYIYFQAGYDYTATPIGADGMYVIGSVRDALGNYIVVAINDPITTSYPKFVMSNAEIDVVRGVMQCS